MLKCYLTKISKKQDHNFQYLRAKAKIPSGTYDDTAFLIDLLKAVTFKRLDDNAYKNVYFSQNNIVNKNI